MLDKDSGGEGEPLEDAGPEWESVEQERDYYKNLSQQYAAKLMMLERVFQATWKIKQDAEGFYADSDDFNRDLPRISDLK